MNAEFRAYINAVTAGCCEEPQPASAAKPIISSVVTEVRAVFAAIGDAIEDIFKHSGPYHCDLHPWTRVRQTLRECCRRHEAIGYHGLA